jgi:hypothetical protein
MMNNNYTDGEFELDEEYLLIDEIELDENSFAQDEDEVTESNLSSDTLYIPLGNPKSIKLVPLAFTFPDHLSPVIEEGFTIAWTKPSLVTFADIQKATHSHGHSSFKNLPYASLRGFLEVVLKNAVHIESNVGLRNLTWNSRTSYQPAPFIYVIGSSEVAINKVIRPILNEWITNYLKPFAEREKVSTEIIERLEDLQEKGELLKISPFASQVLPWIWSNDTGTTKPKDKYTFPMLADYAARQIAGKEVFEGLGPMKRIISSKGNFSSGMAELITNPINIPGKKGRFSLVVRIEVVTYPSLHQPLLKIDVSKRRWLSKLTSSSFDRNDISGFMFSQEYPDRAFSYRLSYQQNKNNKQDQNKRWQTDTDFEILRRELKLPLKSFDGEEIALGKASTDNCEVVLTYRNGLQESSEISGIKAGVPEIDKLEAFEAIAKILESSGFKIFESYSPVKAKHKTDDTASRMINLPTLLGAVMEVLETNCSLEFTPKYLDQLNDSQIDSLLNKYFGIGLEAIDGGKKVLTFNKISPDQTIELKAIIQANQAAMQRLYPKERLSLIIFYEDELQIEMKLLQQITRILWGDTLEIIVNRLPANTHGPRDVLPGNNLKPKERSRQRLEAWKPVAQQIKARSQRTFCLIIARQFYPDPSGEKTAKLDDKVNKPSTRQALATMADASVQFLLPIEKRKKTNSLQLGNFFHRLQASLKDLLSAHSGRIDDVQEKVDKYLKNIPTEARPKEILGITIVRKQKGRARGSIENTFLPVAMRLKVDTGKCELCCAYEKGNRLEISPWKNFSEAIAFIAQLSPITLAKDEDVRKTRFMEFVKQIVSNSVEEQTQPLVIIDSSNCVKLWNWLADTRMNANQIDLGQQYERMQVNWQGARLIRIRQELAPGIIDKKVRQLAETSLEDTRTKDELTSTYEIDSASSSIGLFRLSTTNKTGCVAYLSVGRKTLHQYLRGQSCYRSTNINTQDRKTDSSKDEVKNQAGLKVHRLSIQPPCVDQWPTPNPLEIVVTLRQADDNPDELALLVESLRYSFGHYSDWTSLPAPLFFERVVRDYISDFAIAALNEDIEDQEIERDS